MTVPKRAGIISDIHVGKKSGIVPPDYRNKRDPLAKVQAYLWECFQDFVTRCPAMDILLINGDVIDGDSPSRRDPVGAVTDDIDEQLDAAEETLAPLCAKARATYLIRGTPYHEGKYGDVIEALGRRLKTTPWAAGGRKYSGHVLNLRWHGQMLNVVHHNTRGWMWIGGSVSRMAVLSAAAEQAKKFPHADVIIRSDLHTAITAHTLGKWICYTPAWTMPDLYAIKKMEAVRAHLATDIGARVMSLTDEGITWQNFDYPLYQLPVVNA